MKQIVHTWGSKKMQPLEVLVLAPFELFHDLSRKVADTGIVALVTTWPLSQPLKLPGLLMERRGLGDGQAGWGLRTK